MIDFDKLSDFEKSVFIELRKGNFKRQYRVCSKESYGGYDDTYSAENVRHAILSVLVNKVGVMSDKINMMDHRIEGLADLISILVHDKKAKRKRNHPRKMDKRKVSLQAPRRAAPSKI